MQDFDPSAIMDLVGGGGGGGPKFDFGVGPLNVDLPSMPFSMQGDMLPNLPTTAAPPPPEPGMMDTLAKYGKAVAPWIGAGTSLLGAGLGIEQLGLAKKAQRGQTEALKTAQTAARPAATAAAELIPAGTRAELGGPLPPGLENQALQYQQQLQMQVRQLASQLGIPESTAEAQMEAWVQEQVAAYRQQLAAGLVQSGGALTSAATGGSAVAGQLAGQQGNQLTTALTDANRALSSLMAS